MAALHVDKFGGHGGADGEIGVKGSLKHPESLVVDANFSRLVFNYANVQLENSGPIRFRSSRDNLEIESAAFRGTDTNIQVEGKVQFSGRRALSLRLNGALDLRLVSTWRRGWPPPARPRSMPCLKVRSTTRASPVTFTLPMPRRASPISPRDSAPSKGI